VSANVNARTLALDALETIERRRAYSDAVLDGVLRRHAELPESEKGLLLHLVYGVLRWRNRLDAYLAAASERPLARVHPKLLEILRMGVYQIHHLDRVPSWAAISESVELSRQAGLGHAAGFVNAVLRRVASGPELALPPELGPRLSLLFGCPLWLVERWLSEHGPEGTERLCRAAAAIPALVLRIDPRRARRDAALAELGAAGYEACAGAWGPEAVWIASAGDPRGLALVQQGAAVVQDQASQLIGHLVGPEPGWRVLDACAAPGLKASHLAALMEDRGEILATDLHPNRVRLVQDLAERLGLSSIRAAVADARVHDYGRASFDAVLVDAPCSGLGVLGRTPEAKWRRRAEDIPELARLQAEILANVAGAVRPGGLLIYATCTTLSAENEEIVRGFLEEHADFDLEAPPAEGIPWDELTSEGFFRTYPRHVAGEKGFALDGFFGARLRRRGE
jgi:16S rRNA (cytosine967-C5)-methyltransferase